MKYLMKLENFTESKIYLKTYENFKKEPEAGDYVICNENNNLSSNICNFISNNIGKIVYYINNDEFKKYNVQKDYRYIIEYDNIPANIQTYFSYTVAEDCRRMSRDEIIYWSKNREDLEAIIDAKKYNL